MKLLVICLLFVIIGALPHCKPQHPTNDKNSLGNTLLVKVLKKRSVGCTPCAQPCTQNCQQPCRTIVCPQPQTCHIAPCPQPQPCQTVSCPQQPVCCPSTTTTTTTTTSERPTGGPTPVSTTTTSVTPTPVVHKTGVIATSNVNNRVNVTNVVKSENKIYVPININNVNRVYLKSTIGVSAPYVSSTTDSNKPTTSTTTTQKPVTTTKCPTEDAICDKSKIAIIQVPFHSGYYQPQILPIVDLPCFQGSGCSLQRNFWSGGICDHYGGLDTIGGYWGGSWSDLGLSGCKFVHQDCSECSGNYYGYGSQSYESCYGCFI